MKTSANLPIRLLALSLLIPCFDGAVFGQRGNGPRPGSDVPVLTNYKLVDWPTEAMTELLKALAGAQSKLETK